LSVKAGSLENREREMNLSDRELAALRKRIRDLRSSPPKDAHQHSPGPKLSFCDACFRRGVIAALDALEK